MTRIPHEQQSRSGLACDPFTSNRGDGPARFDNPHAWSYALAGGPSPLYVQRPGEASRIRRAKIAAERAEHRALFRAARDVGPPHTWPVFEGLVAA